MTDSDRPQIPNSTALVAEVMRERAATQLAQVDGLDSTASSALGFAGLLLGLLFANSSITDHWNASMTVAVVLLVLSTGSLAWSLWVQDWLIKPSEERQRSWSGQSLGATEQQLAAALEEAIRANRTGAERKARRVRIGSYLLTAAIVASAVGLMTARDQSDATKSPAKMPPARTTPTATTPP